MWFLKTETCFQKSAHVWNSVSMLQFWEFSYNSSVKYIQGNSSFLQWSSSRRWMCWSRGSRACWSPRQPHLRHRYSQELSLGTGAAPHLETGWICLKSRKPTESFDTVQTVFSNQIHGTSRQDRAWEGSALLCCENRQSKSTFISIVSLLRYSRVE